MFVNQTAMVITIKAMIRIRMIKQFDDNDDCVGGNNANEIITC